MKTPRNLRELFKLFEREGFTVRDFEPAQGSHYRVWFEQFPQYVIVSIFDIDKPRTLRNSIALYRRMRRQHEEGG
jgi:hypothetical protein